MSATGVSLAVVIPTRNRATLAIAACESLLAQADGTFHLFVSDNSTEPAEVRQLADYCAAADPTPSLVCARGGADAPADTLGLGAAIRTGENQRFARHRPLRPPDYEAWSHAPAL